MKFILILILSTSMFSLLHGQESLNVTDRINSSINNNNSNNLKKNVTNLLLYAENESFLPQIEEILSSLKDSIGISLFEIINLNNEFSKLLSEAELDSFIYNYEVEDRLRSVDTLDKEIRNKVIDKIFQSNSYLRIKVFEKLPIIEFQFIYTPEIHKIRPEGKTETLPVLITDKTKRAGFFVNLGKDDYIKELEKSIKKIFFWSDRRPIAIISVNQDSSIEKYYCGISERIEIDGHYSWDQDNRRSDLSFKWRQIDPQGRLEPQLKELVPIEIADPIQHISITHPGIYKFGLTVNDGIRDSFEDTACIEVYKRPRITVDKFEYNFSKQRYFLRSAFRLRSDIDFSIPIDVKSYDLVDTIDFDIYSVLYIPIKYYSLFPYNPRVSRPKIHYEEDIPQKSCIYRIFSSWENNRNNYPYLIYALIRPFLSVLIDTIKFEVLNTTKLDSPENRELIKKYFPEVAAIQLIDTLKFNFKQVPDSCFCKLLSNPGPILNFLKFDSESNFIYSYIDTNLLNRFINSLSKYVVAVYCDSLPNYSTYIKYEKNDSLNILLDSILRIYSLDQTEIKKLDDDSDFIFDIKSSLRNKLDTDHSDKISPFKIIAPKGLLSGVYEISAFAVDKKANSKKVKIKLNFESKPFFSIDLSNLSYYPIKTSERKKLFWSIQPNIHLYFAKLWIFDLQADLTFPASIGNSFHQYSLSISLKDLLTLDLSVNDLNVMYGGGISLNRLFRKPITLKLKYMFSNEKAFKKGLLFSLCLHLLSF